MIKIHKIALLSLCAGLFSCTSEVFTDDTYESIGGSTIKSITVTLPQIEGSEKLATTRTEFVMDADGVKAHWVEGDVIGIFPTEGDQVGFPITNGIEGNKAVFDGGGWGLKANYMYAAYFPYNKDNIYRDNTSILLDYEGQMQNGNGNYDHLSIYDYMASAQVKPNIARYLNLEMQRLGSIVKLELTLPEACTPTSIEITSDKNAFVTKANLDISSIEPKVEAIEESLSFNLELTNIELTDDDLLLTAYMMLSPVAYQTGESIWKVGVRTEDMALYEASIATKDLEAGKAYRFVATLEGSSDFIVFADPEVERICLENWDANEDGKLSYEEAADVTEISGIFKNSSIDSFEELQYFINLETIGKNAFYGSTLRKVVLPDSVTLIDENAFANCHNLENFILPGNLTLIGRSAFSFCTNITAIIIPNEVKSLGVYSFQSCSGLTSVTLSEGLTTIDALAFVSCKSLTELHLPDGLSYIGARAFRGCSNLISINIPSEVTVIEEGLFMDCEKLASIIIPAGVTSIGEEAFSNCSSLQSVIIPDGVTSIGVRAFIGCSSLNCVTCLAVEPPKLIAIGRTSVFDDTNNCPIYVPAGSVESYKTAWTEYTDRIFSIDGSTPEENIVFADNLVKTICLEHWDTNHDGLFSTIEAASVTTLGDAFAGTDIETFEEFRFFTGLETLGYGSNYMYTLNSNYVPGAPESVSHINAAFEGCVKLRRIILPENLTAIGSQAFALCSELTEIEFPVNLEVIGEEAFAASGIISLTIPSSVTSIYNGAFDSCLSLIELYMESVIPPSIYFENTISSENTLFNDCVDFSIYVPDSAIDAYYLADGWSDYIDIIYPI